MSEQLPGTFWPLLKTVKTPRTQISLWLDMVAETPIGKAVLAWMKKKLDEENANMKVPDKGDLHKGTSSQKLFTSKSFEIFFFFFFIFFCQNCILHDFETKSVLHEECAV